MRCRVPILLCVLLVCVAGFGSLPAAGQPQTGGTHLEAQLQDDGDAEWSVTVRLPITDERDREEFEVFADRFESGGGDLDLGTDAFERAAAEAGTATGREMEITSVRRESGVVNETEDGEVVDRYGELRVSFTWTEFARLGENDTLYVDDAFDTTEGTWLPGLGPDQSMTIKAPPGYGAPTTSPIGAEENDLHWEGPETFEPGYFQIVYHPGSSPPGDGESASTLVVGALALSGAALVLGVYLLTARRWEETWPLPFDTGPDSEPEGSDPTPADAPDATAHPVAASGTPSGGVGSESAASADPVETEDRRDVELLSDEERVEYLLERNGGRMKQANIVKETGWSNAKVSQLLSTMDDGERIDKLRIGRENLISLPGEGIGDIEGDDGER